MNYIDKIKRLYLIADDINHGYHTSQLDELEKRLNVTLPLELKIYYTTLGTNENINFSYNRLLKPDNEIGISDDFYLIFYEENQASTYWGINSRDLEMELDNPSIWGNYGTNQQPDWYLEASTTQNFLLLMAINNGTLGGLTYNANSFEPVRQEMVKEIQKNWILITEISHKKQQFFTDDYHEVISLSFDNNDCTFMSIGTNHQDRFDKLLKLEIKWSYISYEDE